MKNKYRKIEFGGGQSIEITGKTKAEYDAEAKAANDRYEEEERKHKEAIPKLTKEWIEKGKKILDEKYHETWEICVPIRLGDIYRGMELGATLDIVKELNAGCELEVAKGIIEGQGHSGTSFGLVCSMVKSFCDRGKEFFNYVRSEPPIIITRCCLSGLLNGNLIYE